MSETSELLAETRSLEATAVQQSARRLITAIFLFLSAYFILTKINMLYSASVDLAHHTVLVARLMDYLNLGGPADPSLGPMVRYSPYAHVIGAVFGTLVNSPILGMQVVVLTSLVAIWSSWALAAGTMPNPFSFLTILSLVLLFILNDTFIHLEVFGNEIISNYFYPQFVAQAFTCAIIAVVTGLAARERPAWLQYGLLGLTALLVSRMHLLPALEILAVLTVFVFADAIAAGTRRRLVNVVAGATFTVLATGLILVGPDWRELTKLANWDGGLGLRYMPEPEYLSAFALVVLVCASLVLFRWTRSSVESRRAFTFVRSVAAFAIASSGLCILQFIALKLGYGSPYSVKKYAFGVSSSFLLLAATGLGVAGTKIWQRFQSLASPPSALVWGGICGIPLMLLVTPSFFQPLSSLSRLVNIERYARLTEKIALGDPAPQSDFAIGIRGIGPVGNILMSMVPLRAPWGDSINYILKASPFKDEKAVRYLLTSIGSGWDIPACRRTQPSLALVFVSAACLPTVKWKPGVRVGPQALDPLLTKGWSRVESWGVWSDGRSAQLTLPIHANEFPSGAQIEIEAIGFAPRKLQQVTFVAPGVEPMTIQLGSQHHTVVIAVPSSALSAKRPLEIRLEIPDAVSPNALGVSTTDPRELGVGLLSLQVNSPP